MIHRRRQRSPLASLCLAALAGTFGSCASDRSPRAREPVVGLPCEGCEAAFDEMPSQIPPSLRMVESDEPGEPLRLTGIVREPSGAPAPGIILYIYQTDATGVYPPGNAARTPDGKLHGRLRGWLRTDADGGYALETIRPGGYPGDIEPQHIHIHVIEPGRCTYYIDDVVFDDDPRLTPRMRARSTGRGGSGLVAPVRDDDGRWLATRDITLGAGIADYPSPERASTPRSAQGEGVPDRP